VVHVVVVVFLQILGDAHAPVVTPLVIVVKQP